MLSHGGTRAPPQETPRPPVAAPRSSPQRPSPVDSAAREHARAREQATVDSLRRVMEARSESIMRARRIAAGPPAKPTRGPLFGEPPFYGYNWVFYADLLAGVLTGLLAVRWRSRNDPAGARMVWMVVGVLLGAAGAAAVFLPLYLLNAMFSIGFSAMPPVLMFGLTLGVIAIGAVSMAFSRRRG